MLYTKVLSLNQFSKTTPLKEGFDGNTIIVSLAESKKRRLTNTDANFICVFRTCLTLPLISCYVRALGARSVREKGMNTRVGGRVGQVIAAS